jgi:hypothetical protein
MDEVAIYRIVGIIFLAGLPVAIICIVRPARSVIRKRVRWIAAGFIGLGSFFIGWVASWPGPNMATDIMMLGGLILFLGASFLFVRTFLTKSTSPTLKS